MDKNKIMGVDQRSLRMMVIKNIDNEIIYIYTHRCAHLDFECICA